MARASAQGFLKLEPEPQAWSSQSCGLETARLPAARLGQLTALRPGLHNTKHKVTQQHWGLPSVTVTMANTIKMVSGSFHASGRGHRKIRVAGCVHCMHVHELAWHAACMHRILMCTCMRSINPCVHLYRSLDYEIGIYVEIRRHVVGTQMSSSLKGMLEVEAVSRGLDNR